MIKGKNYLIIISGILLLTLILAFQFSLFGYEFSWNEYYNDKNNLFLSQSTDHQYLLEWNKIWNEYDVSEVSGIGVDSSDNVFIVGSIKSLDTGKDDVFLLKYNKTGDLLWNKIWGGPNYDNAYGLVIDSSDNIYIVGSTGNDTGEYVGFELDKLKNLDIILIKYNNLGVEQWHKTWGGSFDEVGRAIALDLENNIYIVGDSNRIDEDHPPNLDIDVILVKFDCLGNYQWDKILYDLRGMGWEHGRGVEIDSSNNIYIAGYMHWEEMMLWKYTSSGIQEWNTIRDMRIMDIGGIAVDSSDNIYIIGTTGFHSLGTTIFLSKYNCSGKQKWYKAWMNVSYPAQDHGTGIAIDSVDNVYAIGTALLKYNSNGALLLLTTEITGKKIGIDSEDNLFITGASGSDVFLRKYNIDSDGDGLSDREEENIYFTDPYDSDSDDDGLTDGAEINNYSTDPNDSDSDDDGLTDDEEVNSYLTDPNNSDTDGDGFKDGEEVFRGFDPNNALNNLLMGNIGIIIILLTVFGLITIFIIYPRIKVKRKVEDLESELSKQTSI